MSRAYQGTTFAEVLPSSGVSCQPNRANGKDSRLMLYCQGIKLYIPDEVQYETILTTLRAIKQL